MASEGIGGRGEEAAGAEESSEGSREWNTYDDSSPPYLWLV